MIGGKSQGEKNKTLKESQDIVAAFGKSVFEKLFCWIIKKCNTNLEAPIPAKACTFGLLDIFGFESFDADAGGINSLEQFCINYANEKLQQLYINCMFEAEKETFIQEGLEKYAALIHFEGNGLVIQLMDKPANPIGVFRFLKSVSDKKDGTDQELLDKCERAWGKEPKVFTSTRIQPLNSLLFKVTHSQKQVPYDFVGFKDKNNDMLPDEMIEVINAGNKVMARVYNGKITDDEVIDEGKVSKWIGEKFQIQMAQLMDTLMATELSFMRCIKVNELKAPHKWFAGYALNQISYLGILDTIKLRQVALPVRYQYIDFYSKFQDLDALSEDRGKSFLELKALKADFRPMGENVQSSAFPEHRDVDWLAGTTRMFMSGDYHNKLIAKLEAVQKAKKDALQVMTDTYRAWLFASKWNKFRTDKVHVVERAKDLFYSWNSRIEYARFQRLLRNIGRIQTNYHITKFKRMNRLHKYISKIISRNYKFYKIRKVFMQANKLATTLNNCKEKILYRRFFIRVRKAREHVGWIFDHAWNEIMKRFYLQSAVSVQRTLRGHLDRLKCQEDLKELEVIKRQLAIERNATFIQKWIRGFLVRARLDRLKRAANYIEGFVRMRWLRKYFLLMRRAAVMIQRFLRSKISKKMECDDRMAVFLKKNHNFLSHLKKVEQAIMFQTGENSLDSIKTLDAYSKTTMFQNGRRIGENLPRVPSFVPNEASNDFNPKIKLFSTLIDFDCMVDTTDIYDQNWSVDYLNFVTALHGQNGRVMHLDVGQTFSMAITDDLKMYTWGLNDYLQLGRTTNFSQLHSGPECAKPLSKIVPKIVTCGDDHGVIIDYNGNCYTWGANNQGQLGVGNSRMTPSIVSLSKVGKNIRYAATKGHTSYVINNDGHILKWPNPGYAEKFTPMIMGVRDNSTKFVSLSCGTDYSIALSSNGLLFGHGLNNFGQLGVGDTCDRGDGFTMLRYFKEHGDKMVQVSCGHAHSLAKSSSGKLFAWGLNNNGQLGTGDCYNSDHPKCLRIPEYKNNVFKVRNIQAGYHNSFCLCEDKKVFLAGVNSTTCKDQKLFTRLEYENRVFKGKLSEDFSPLKLYTKWSHSLQVTYLVYADFRGCKESKLVREKILQNLVKNWEDCYHQSNLFPLKKQPCHRLMINWRNRLTRNT